MEKHYQKPQVTRVALVPEEALLNGCKTTQAQYPVPNLQAGGDPFCDSTWGICWELGS